MKTAMNNKVAIAAVGTFLLIMTVASAPLDQEDDPQENFVMGRSSSETEFAPWDAVDIAAFRKLLMQIDSDHRLGRVSRSWPQAEPRGWGVRALDGRVARQWRADKRQVRFRQCYFNPISCFRK